MVSVILFKINHIENQFFGYKSGSRIINDVPIDIQCREQNTTLTHRYNPHSSSDSHRISMIGSDQQFLTFHL